MMHHKVSFHTIQHFPLNPMLQFASVNHELQYFANGLFRILLSSEILENGMLRHL